MGIIFTLIWTSRIDTRCEWFHVYRDNITFVKDGVHIPSGEHGFKIECSQVSVILYNHLDCQS